MTIGLAIPPSGPPAPTRRSLATQQSARWSSQQLPRLTEGIPYVDRTGDNLRLHQQAESSPYSTDRLAAC